MERTAEGEADQTAAECPLAGWRSLSPLHLKTWRRLPRLCRLSRGPQVIRSVTTTSANPDSARLGIGAACTTTS